MFILLPFILPVICAYNVLSFSGGGSFGSVEIGLLQRIQEFDPKIYDLYAGISVGGLNAGFLSYFKDINVGIKEVKAVYSTLKNKDVYEYFPITNSLLNTAPLHNTITNVISKYNDSVKETLIGTTNLYTGKLDTYYYNSLEKPDQVDLLMATSAIPVIFPPIHFKDQLYVDGGVITNELLSEIRAPHYINITFITPYSELTSNYNLTSFTEIVKRNLEILGTFNNELGKMVCDIPRGEINMYFIVSSLVSGYSLLDFDYGKELHEIGYNNLQYIKYPLC